MKTKVISLALLFFLLVISVSLRADDVAVLTSPPSSPPTNIVAIFNNIGETVTVSWRAATDATYYIVEFKRLLFTAGKRYSDWQQIGTTTTNSVKHPSTIMENSFKTYYGTMVYYYRVKACNSIGCSDYSEPVSIVVLRQRSINR